MRAFKGPNLSGGWKCPICGTSDDKEVVLIGVDGTEDDGIMEGHQYHLDCIELMEYNLKDKNERVIAMRFVNKGSDK